MTQSSYAVESAMEAAELGIFMFIACVAAFLLNHPDSAAHQAIASDSVKRLAGGVAMGITALTLFRSSWGRRSGAHLNPAVSWTFCWLGKLSWRQAVAYSLAQALGGIMGVWLARLLLGAALAHPAVDFATTMPGPRGEYAAFLAEFTISMLMMSAVLWTSNSAKFARWTPYVAASLVTLFIFFESPYSGMSMNPARSFASAALAGRFDALWIYLLAPMAGMLSAAFLYRSVRGLSRVYCAKLNHFQSTRCIFRCNFGDLHAQ